MFFFPIPQDKYESKFPWVVGLIILIDANLLVPLFMGDGTGFISHFGLKPNHVTPLTFFASIFLHAGLLHFAGNMWFFWIFGRRIESCLGYFEFAASYLLCGIGANITYILLNWHSSIPCIGASGAISGMAGMYFILFPFERFNLHILLGYWRLAKIPTDTRIAMSVWIGEQAVLGILSSFSRFSSTAFSAHVGGFLAGMALGYFFDSRVPLQEGVAQAASKTGLKIEDGDTPPALIALGLIPREGSFAIEPGRK